MLEGAKVHIFNRASIYSLMPSLPETGSMISRAFILGDIVRAVYATFTSITFGFVFSDFGKWRVNTPS